MPPASRLPGPTAPLGWQELLPAALILGLVYVAITGGEIAYRRYARPPDDATP